MFIPSMALQVLPSSWIHLADYCLKVQRSSDASQLDSASICRNKTCHHRQRGLLLSPVLLAKGLPLILGARLWPRNNKLILNIQYLILMLKISSLLQCSVVWMDFDQAWLVLMGTWNKICVNLNNFPIYEISILLQSQCLHTPNWLFLNLFAL